MLLKEKNKNIIKTYGFFKNGSINLNIKMNTKNMIQI